jgi:hypothetical protein
LRVALEDKAQDILLRYLTGDEVPQSQGISRWALATWMRRVR